jgi:hypothetical protein
MRSSLFSCAVVAIASTCLAPAANIADEPADSVCRRQALAVRQLELSRLTLAQFAKSFRPNSNKRSAPCAAERSTWHDWTARNQVVFNRPAPAAGPSTYFPSAAPESMRGSP